MQLLYGALSAVGLGVSCWFLGLFMVRHGVDVSLAVRQLFQSPMSSVSILDLVVCWPVFWLFLWQEGKKYTVRHLWIYPLLTISIGLCFALPLFLFFRQGRIDQQER